MKHKNIVKEDIKNIAESIKKESGKLSGKKIMMSGGAGFLGSYIVSVIKLLNKEYLKKPCQMIILDNYITGHKENPITNFEDENISMIEHDVRKDLPENLDADFVIHAAGLASPFYYRKFPIETIEVAVTGTKNFLEFARKKKVQSMLFFSSSEIYGDPDPEHIPTPEHYWGNVDLLGPRSCYDESKRLGETLCKTYHEVYEVPVKIVRPFNVYGPGMKLKDYRVIPTFMAKALAGENLPVHGQGNQTRTFCYISDAIQGFLKILLSNKNGEVYNVGRQEDEINVSGLASMIASIAPKPITINLIEYPETYPAGEPQRRCPDLTKITKELKYKSNVDLKNGLKRTLAWYEDISKEERK